VLGAAALFQVLTAAVLHDLDRDPKAIQLPPTGAARSRGGCVVEEQAQV
jgi:hypothetical protein